MADSTAEPDGVIAADRSPEARRRQALRWRAGLEEHVGAQGKFWATRFYRVVSRVVAGAWNDGFIHAGNLAYMAILALFPFFITVAAVFTLFGEEAQREASIHTFLSAVPPVVAQALEPVARDVSSARTGWLLWIGGIVGLWTVGSLIETIRDILRRAYGTRASAAFWRYRLISSGVTAGAVVALLFALLAQVADRRGAGDDRGVVSARVRLGGHAGNLAIDPGGSAVCLAVFAVLYTDPLGLPRAALSQMARRAAGHHLVGRGGGGAARRVAALFHL